MKHFSTAACRAGAAARPVPLLAGCQRTQSLREDPQSKGPEIYPAILTRKPNELCAAIDNVKSLGAPR